MMIAVGAAIFLWSRWLLPRQLRRVSARAQGRAKERYDELMRSSIITQMAVAPTIMGGILILVGLVFWLTE
jgi:hypothetical protein